MKMELDANEDVVFSRQHNRVREQSRGGKGNQARLHVSPFYIFFWLITALLSMSSWLLKLCDII